MNKEEGRCSDEKIFPGCTHCVDHGTPLPTRAQTSQRLGWDGMQDVAAPLLTCGGSMNSSLAWWHSCCHHMESKYSHQTQCQKSSRWVGSKDCSWLSYVPACIAHSNEFWAVMQPWNIGDHFICLPLIILHNCFPQRMEPWKNRTRWTLALLDIAADPCCCSGTLIWTRAPDPASGAGKVQWASAHLQKPGFVSPLNKNIAG